MKRLKLAGIGCGGRTATYLGLAAQMPEYYEVVAAADPLPGRVESIKRLSRNPAYRGFDSDKAILAVDKLADVMIIGTQDAYHVTPCIAAMQKGYDILLEKPIATNLDDVIRLEAMAARLKRKVLVCHVLRYTPFYRKVKEIIDSGVLGDVVSINANEGVGAWHQGHSFVRGHWSVVERASPMIVAKCCHDMDILSWLVGRPCLSVSSFGSLTHFASRNAPAGAPKRCTDGCPVGTSCHYNALHYLNAEKTWLTYVMDGAESADDEQKRRWLSTSPWGRCVYHCDNTAVDHQVVNLAFEGGVTATFTMTAFENGRQIEIYGTRGKLRGGEFVKHTTHSDIVVSGLDNAWETRHGVEWRVGGYAGHGGGDAGLVLALYDEMMKSDPAAMLSSLSTSVESHVMGYAAEESRQSGRTVQLDEVRRRHGGAGSPRAAGS